MIDEWSPEFLPMAYKWRLVRTFARGEEDIKNAGEEYLPRKARQSDADYDAYRARAKTGDFTGEALKRLHGMVFRRTPTMELPCDGKFSECIANIDRKGRSLYQFASDVAMDNMQTLWGGLILDMPVADGIETEHDAEEAGVRPYLKYYPAEDIVDRGFRELNGVERLSYVVLKETVDRGVSENLDRGSPAFSHRKVVQYRLLDLDESGYYRVRVYSPEVNEKGETSYVSGKPIYVKVRGERLRYIPFGFLPGEEPEKPMLYGTAELHKHFYMQSADYENGIHYTTIPTGWSSGHTPLNDEHGRPESITLGGDSWLNFPEPEAKVGTLAFAGEGLSHAEHALEKTHEEIGVMGTRMLAPDKAMSETKDAAQIHRIGENSSLATYTRNFSEKFTWMLSLMAEWMGVEGKVNVEFNVDYDSVAFDPNALNAIANLSREGKFPAPYVYEALKKGEYLPNDSTLAEYILLMAIEDAGVPLEEEFELYRRMRAGEDISLPKPRRAAPPEPDDDEPDGDSEGDEEGLPDDEEGNG